MRQPVSLCLMALLLVPILSSAAVAQDDQTPGLELLTCVFTEPFIDVTFDPATRELAQVLMTTDRSVLAKPATVTVVDATQLAATEGESAWFTVETADLALNFADSKGEVKLTIVRDGNGSDGMSDTLYPFAAKMGDLIGGCSIPSQPIQVKLYLEDILGRLGVAP